MEYSCQFRFLLALPNIPKLPAFPKSSSFNDVMNLYVVAAVMNLYVVAARPVWCSMEIRKYRF